MNNELNKAIENLKAKFEEKLEKLKYIYQDFWYGNDSDEDCFNLGNCYRTRGEAEFAIERKKVFTELDRLADSKVDLDGCYHICISDSNFVNVALTMGKDSPFTFSTEELAEKAIKEIGEERLKKYYFMVE